MIGFLHTASVHGSTFDGLVHRLAPEVATVAEIRPELLADARAHGADAPVVVEGVSSSLDRLDRAGCEVIVCTCSTIGEAAERLGVASGRPVIRVDRPMAERAVEVGGRIVVLAAVESTLEPTARLLRQVADEAGRPVDIDVRLVDGAWLLFDDGDTDGYLDAIASAITTAVRDAGVVVLAQASMAAAAGRVAVSVPVLSSPAPGVERAVEIVRAGRGDR